MHTYTACHHLNLLNMQKHGTKEDMVTYEGVKNTIANIREAIQKVPNSHVAIALDNKGPEIRTGWLKGVSRKLYNLCENVIAIMCP